MNSIFIIYKTIIKFFAKFILIGSAIMFLSASSYAGDQTSEGYALSTSIWTQLSIPVCWINPTAANMTERAWVQNSIKRTWERNSQVYFTGWGQCPQSNVANAIRIMIADVGPYTAILGKQIVNYNPGMELNFTFQTWSPVCRSNETYRRFCIEAIAVHEFGHALGFSHEQNRPDTPPTPICTQSPQGQNGNILIGAWDLSSVMNYCNPNWNGNGQLSTTDIQMVQMFYNVPLRDNDFTFDADFYLSYYPDLRAGYGGDQQAALNHWKNHGIKEGRRGSREFDVTYYLSLYPDLRNGFGNNYAAALNHWITHGINEGRRGSREVDAAYYLAKYPDLRKGYGYNYRLALTHWAMHGLNEQRQGSADFNVADYFNRYPDLREWLKYTVSPSSFANDSTLGFLHWIQYGIAEGRNGQ